MRRKRTWLVGLLICISATLSAQRELPILSENLEEWNDGSIILNNGTELIGKVRFNAFEGILSFQNGKDSRSLRANSVQTFEYHDPRTNSKRTYFTIPQEDDVNGLVRPMFFEVIRQFENFAVLAKITPIAAQEITNRSPSMDPNFDQSPLYTNKFIKLEYKEEFYVLSESGDLEEFAEMKRIMTKGQLFDKNAKHTKITDRHVLKQHFAPHYEAMEKYAKENDLEWDEREDMVKLLDYYKNLVKE